MNNYIVGTSQGMLSKIVLGNKVIKGASDNNLEPFSEYIGSRVFAKFSGLPTVIYDTASVTKFQVKSLCGYVSICKRVDYEIFNFYKYMEIRGKKLNDVLKVYKDSKLSEEYLLRVLIMDALIGNQDRHWNNFDIYIGEDGTLKNAPVLDFGASLLYNVPDSELKSGKGIGKDISKPLKDTHYKQVKYLKKLYGNINLFNFDWYDLLKVLLECYSNLPKDIFTSKRRRVLINYLYNRYNQYIIPFLK